MSISPCKFPKAGLASASFIQYRIQTAASKYACPFTPVLGTEPILASMALLAFGQMSGRNGGSLQWGFLSQTSSPTEGRPYPAPPEPHHYVSTKKIWKLMETREGEK